MCCLYSEADMKQLKLDRELQVLKPLLIRINIEESQELKDYLVDKSTNLDLDFTKNILFLSNEQIYKSYSVYGLTHCYDRKIKYKVVDFSVILDIWYRESSVISKDSILRPDLLIIQGHINNDIAVSNKESAIIDIVNTRRLEGKNTWLFFKGCTMDDFRAKYPEVIKVVDKVHNSKF